MHLKSHSDLSFVTDDPDALAAHLHGRYDLVCICPYLNEAYRLVSDSGDMIVMIYANGTVLVQGRQVRAALLLSNLCESEGVA